MSSKKILNILIVTGIFPPDIGGPARFVPHIADELQKKGMHCQIVTLSEQETCNGNDSPAVYRIKRHQNLIKRFLQVVWVIFRRARTADVLLVNGLYFENAVATLLAGRPSILKIVGDAVWEQATRKGWTSDSLLEFQNRNEWKIDLLRALRRIALNRAKYVVVPSRFTKNLVNGWVKKPISIEVIYNAVQSLSDFPVYHCPSKPKSSWRLITVSRLIHLKRIDQLIWVVGKLPNTTLVVVGDGPELSFLKDVAREYGVKEKVEFTGPLAPRDVVSEMTASNIFVLNSMEENFPHVILEAMAAGLPVVATRVGGVPEVVVDGKNGLLIQPDRPNELKIRIDELMNDSALRERLALAGRETIKNYSWETLTDRFLNIMFHATGKFQ